VIEFARSTRSVYPPLLPIPAHEQFVRIDVKLPWPLATKYREGLVASNGDQLWLQEFSASILPATKESTIVLPTSVVPPGKLPSPVEGVFDDDHFEESGD